MDFCFLYLYGLNIFCQKNQSIKKIVFYSAVFYGITKLYLRNFRPIKYAIRKFKWKKMKFGKNHKIALSQKISNTTTSAPIKK